MGNVAKRELKRILAFFVAVCMWHTAVLPWNISFADTTSVVTSESNKSNESKPSTVVPMTVTVEGPSKSETPSGSTPVGTTGETASSSTSSGTTGETPSGSTPSGTTGETAGSSTPSGTTGETPSGSTPVGTTGETAGSSTPSGTTGETASSSTPVGTTGETPSEPTEGETPSEPIAGETPSEPTEGETPSEPTEGETPSEPTEGETPSEPTEGETPSEPTEGETPSEPTEGETPSEPTEGETPSEPTEGETPSEPTEGETPSEPMAGETPNEPTEGETPSKPMAGETPSEPTEGETPSEPMEGETPSEPTEGETPSEPTEGETPSEPMEGETPSEPTEGETPSEPTEGETPSEPTEGETPSEPTVGETPSESITGSATGETINEAFEENIVGSYFSTLNTSLGSDIPNVIGLNEAEVEPSLTFVSASSNSDTNYVKEGNIITFVVTAIGIIGKPSISLGNVPVPEANIVSTGENTYQATLTLPNSLSNGNIRYEVNASDEAEKTVSISGNLTIIFDNVAPSTPAAGTVRLKKEIGSKIAYSKIEVNDTNGVKSVKIAKDLSDDETTWGEVQWQDIVVSSESESQFVSGAVGKQEFDIVINEIGTYTLLVTDMAGNETIGKNIVTVADGDPMLVIGNLPKTEYVVNSEPSIDLTGGTLLYGTTFTDATTIDMTDSENVSCKTSTDILTTTGNNKPVILSYQGITCTFSINVVAGKKYITFASDELQKNPATTFSERITYSTDEVSELYYVWSNNKDITGEEEIYTPSNKYTNLAPFRFSGKIEQADKSNTSDAWYFDDENGMFRSPNNKISADGGTSYETITITPINDQDGKARISFDYKTDSRTIHEMIISINGKEVGRTSGKPDWISYVGEHIADEDGKYIVELKYVKDSTIGTTEDYAAIRNLKFYDDKVWNSLDATKGSANLNLESVLGYRNYLHVKGESKDGIPFHEVSTEFYGDVTLQGVAIYKVPNQTLYNLNSNLNTEGGELTLFFDKGTEIISLDDISKNENIALPEFDSSTPGIKEIKIIYEHTDGTQFTAYYTVLVEEKRTTDIVNPPEYLDGMVPVKWYESTDNSESYWVVTTWEDSEWYDYDFSEKRWANVMLRDGLEVRQVDDPMSASIAEMAGKRVISEGSMFVWIPRFTYAVTDSYETSGIVSIRWSNGVIDDQSDDFLIHPAFRNVAYRGGDPNSASSYVSDPTQNELSGFWMAKFESSYNDDNLLQIKADQIPVYGETFISALEDSQNMISVNYSNYGISDDAYSRLTKNSEWGAVAFLSVGNTSNQYAEDNEPYVNNVIFNSKTRTGYSSETGNDSGVSDPAKIGTTVFRYNTAEGVNASTTKNIYGIYDMVGGVREYVASFYPSDDVVATVESFASDYETSADFDVIDIDADLYNYKGFAITDMIYEEAELYVEDGLWNYDIVNHIEERDIVTRGGVYKDQEGAGLFNMVTVSPDPDTDKITDKEDALYTGFRPTILVGEQKETKISISNVKIYSSNSSNNQYAKTGDTITIEFTASDMVYVTDAKVGTGTTLVSINYDQSKTAKNWSLTYTVKESDSGRVKFEISYKGQTNESDTGTVPEPTNFSVLVDNKVNGGIGGSEGESGGSEGENSGIISTRPSGSGIEIDVDSNTGEDEAPIKIILWQRNDDKELKAKDDFYDENGELIVSDEAGNIIGGDITEDSGFTATDPGVYWIFIEDEAGNQSITKILINDDELDKKPPTVEDVKIYVNDVLVENTAFAKKNDVIKLEMTFSEELNRAPDVTILESPYSADDITKQGNKYLLYHTATLNRSYDELPFSIVNYQDKSSNTAIEATTNPANNGNIIYDVDLVGVSISDPVDVSSNGENNFKYTVTFTDKYLSTDDISFGTDNIEIITNNASSATYAVRIGNVVVGNVNVSEDFMSATADVTFSNVTGEGSFGFKVKAGTEAAPFVHDKAGNPNVQAFTTNAQMSRVDTCQPSIATASIYSNNELDNQYAKNGDTITIEFTTREPISNAPVVVLNALDEFNMRSMTVTGSETAWTAVYTIPENEGSISEGKLNFRIMQYADLFGNDGIELSDESAIVTTSVIYDRTKPSLSINPNGGTFTDTDVTISLSDNLAGIYDTTIQYAWGEQGNVPTTDWMISTVTENSVMIHSPSGLTENRCLYIKPIRDWANNTTEMFVSNVFEFNNRLPELTIEGPTPTQTKNGSVVYRIVYDEHVTDITLTSDKITLTNSEITADITISDGENDHEKVVTLTNITGNGVVGINVLAGSARNSAGITDEGAGPSNTFVVDNTAPTITFAPVSGSTIINGNIVVGISDPTVNGASTGLATDNVYQYAWSDTEPTTWTNFTLSNGIANIPTSGLSGTRYLWINTVSDAVGNTTTANAQFIIDSGSVDMTITSISSNNSEGTNPRYAKNGDTITIVMTATKALLSAPTVTIMGRTATVTNTEGTTWTATYTIPTDETELTEGVVTFAINNYQDEYGNEGPLKTQANINETVTYDRTVPTIAIDKQGGTYAQTNVIVTLNGTGTDIYGSTIEYMWSETTDFPESGWSTASIVRNQATISSPTDETGKLVNGSRYLLIKAVEDSARNASNNFASPLFTFNINKPTLTISAPNVIRTKHGPVIYTVQYSGVNNIILDETFITINGGVTGDITVTPGQDTTQKIVTISNITGNGIMSISIAAGSSTNVEGDLDEGAGPSQTVIVDNIEPTFTDVTITSNNVKPQYAKNGDTITITMTASETLLVGPTVTIMGRDATVTNPEGNTWVATYTIPADEATLTEGNVTFSISGYKDETENMGQTVTTATSGSVIYDRTNPSISINPNGGKFKDTAVNVTLSDLVSGIADTEIRYYWSRTNTISGSIDWETATLQEGTILIWSPVELNSSRYLIIDGVTDNSGNTCDPFISDEFDFENKYTVTASVVGGEGTITPVGANIINSGRSITFAIAPARHYKIGSILIDDVELETLVNEYTFEEVRENHTIKVLFVDADKYMLETSISNGISIECLQYADDDITVTTSGGNFVETKTSGIASVTSGETVQFVMPANEATITQVYAE